MAAAAWVMVIGGCGGDSTEPDLTLPGGSMSARIDGSPWQATALVHASRVQNSLTVGGGGTMGGQAVAIAISAMVPDGPGTYTFGPGVNGNAIVGVDQTASWMASATMGSGSVTITTLDGNRVAGTFAFTAVAVAGGDATGTRTVTEGQFDILF